MSVEERLLQLEAEAFAMTTVMWAVVRHVWPIRDARDAVRDMLCRSIEPATLAGSTPEGRLHAERILAAMEELFRASEPPKKRIL